ncbi:hypothetical protein ACJX0J_039049, partial [Zea mays]
MAYFLAVFWGLGSSSCTRLATLFSSFFMSLAFGGHPIRLATACAAASRAPFDLASSSRTSSGMHPCSPTSRFITWTRRGSTQSDTRLSAETALTRFRTAATGDSCGSGPS